MRVVAVVARIDFGRVQQRVGVGTIAVDHQLAVLTDACTSCQAEAVGAVATATHQGAAGELVIAGRLGTDAERGFAHIVVGACLHAAHHGVVGNVDGQGCRAEVSVTIDDGVGEGIDRP
ncbi:hypothetical protein D3C84_832360 [compost metagenome]